MAQPLKIAFLLPFLEVYGAVRTMIDLSNQMVDRGHLVTIYHGDGGSCNWLRVKAGIKPKIAILDQENDIVLGNLRGIVGLLEACKARLKLYWVADRWSEFDSNFQLMLKSNWVKLAVTKWSQEWLFEREVRSYYLPPGVNRGIFYPVGRPNDSGVLRLLCSGDRRPGKGFSYVLQAMDVLRDFGLDFELRSYSGKGLPQSQMAEVYGSANIFIDAQWGDAALRNNPVVEAMACGVPVVCLDHESVSDWAEHRKTAFLISRREPVLMAQGVMQLNKDRVLMHQIWVNALKKVGAFTWSGAAEKLEAIIEKERAAR